MFASVVVANRGEIALRIFRTLRRLGIRSVAVYSDADADARHVREADSAVRLARVSNGAGAGRAGVGAAAYLSVESVVDAALRAGVDAVHPGYGFLSENAEFARAVIGAGLVWVGPPPEVVDAMADKVRAKAIVAVRGVPTVPGGGGPGMSDGDLAAVAGALGYPVLVKPSAGGGGKGMHLVVSPGELAAALATARREAAAWFSDDTLLVERWIERPRHLEIQVLADTHGKIIHLGERECSLQRRHQKVVEEAPSPLFVGRRAALRDAMGDAAVDAARAAGYVGAGTVEFVVPGDEPTKFYFLEMNTRLQVEHPVTEAVTGVDLVEWQLRVAAGEPLDIGRDVSWRGHAIEARVYAEDPTRGFLPTGGPVMAWRPPEGTGIRVDDGIAAGNSISSDFDPMIAKVIAWADTRAEALVRLARALEGTTLLGLATNVGYLHRLVTHPSVLAGTLDTGFIERSLAELTATEGGAGSAPQHVVVAAALLCRHLEASSGRPDDVWSAATGWRAGGPAWSTWRMRPAGGEPLDVRVRLPGHGPPAGAAGERLLDGRPAGGEPASGEPASGRFEVAIDDQEPAPARFEVAGDDLDVEVGGLRLRYSWAYGLGWWWLGRHGMAWGFEEVPPAPARAHAGMAGAAGHVRSPMPGTVRAVHVAVGDEVAEGQAVVTVEAMKMEYVVVAPSTGRAVDVLVREGQRVAVDQELAVLAPAGADGRADELRAEAPVRGSE
ncbi:MAG TPA: biotin carboxylase N-terminal domain-containing protein [Acidimicrobiales bacterium]|nr:biotin carboxylase N-terminal domain-containing protein [Acidimicrobiales bacterium]